MLDMIIMWVWIIGWVGATICTAAVIGNSDNVHGSGDKSFPTFLVPMFFGWSWPVIVASMILMAPLFWLSDRATERRERGNTDDIL